MTKRIFFQIIRRRSNVRKLAFYHQAGATLVEGLIASVIIATVSVMAMVAGNSVIALVNRTDGQSRFNALIDNDISRIRKLSQAYNACDSPTGSISTSGTGCVGYSESSSYYYFPDPESSTGTADVGSFDQACASSSTSGHILENFIVEVSSQALPSTIQRTVSRQDESDPDNYLVEVRYSAPGGISRTVALAPYLSFWCR